MISETLLSGSMTINVKPPVLGDRLLVVFASDKIGLSISLTTEQAKGLLIQLQGKLNPIEERELVSA